MSRAQDCPSCAMGNHERHDPNWGITPGLIGGSYCPCDGDCPERFKESARKIAEFWGFGKG